MRIGIDLMGSDRTPMLLFEGVVQAAEQLPSSTTLVAIASHSVVNTIKEQLNQLPPNPQRAAIELYPVSETIVMSDEPVSAVRRKREASIVVGIRLLKRQRLDAFISAGNSGALLASASLSLPKLPGVQRPALLVVLPTVTGSVAVLDVGGNVFCKTHHLVQFAHMGAAYQSCSEEIAHPMVGLLNIGAEAQKGTLVMRNAYQALQEYTQRDQAPFRFYGNIEGRDLFQGKVDVVVTDGFTGNVLLKTSEGVSSFIFGAIQEMMQTMPPNPIQQSFRDLKRYFSYAEYPGAILCGVEGIVIKCHGDASPKALCNCIKGATTLVHKQLIPKLKMQLAALGSNSTVGL